jgi:hypothetical protein
MRYRTSNGNSGTIGRYGDDLYAGKDGNVYRRTDNGWQSYDNGNWSDVNRDNVNRDNVNRDNVNRDNVNRDVNNANRNVNRDSVQQLDRQSTQRSMGTQRSTSSQNFRRSAPSMPRGGGGGFRRR